MLTTRRLLLRPQEASDAEVFHQLWAERDPRVPAHRRLDARGRPTVQVIAWARELGHRRLWASVWDWNIASLRVLEKLEFRDSGVGHPAAEHGRTILTVRDL